MRDHWKVVCIADTHGHEQNLMVPDGDVLIHAGDVTMFGHEKTFYKFMDWFAALPHPHKILVAGNHDNPFEKKPELTKRLAQSLFIHYLENSSVVLESDEVTKPLKIYGTPIQPVSGDMAFNRDDDEREAWFQEIPEGLDILITHCPPYTMLDEVTSDFKSTYMGCRFLLDRVQEVKPRYHVFGHVHRQYGKIRRGDTTFVNAAVTLRHSAIHPDHKPWVLEV